MSRRQKFHDFYAGNQHRSLSGYDYPAPTPTSAKTLLNGGFPTDLTRAAVASEKYRYKGDQIVNAIVVRADLNNYSKWAADKPMPSRVKLLSEFFTEVVKDLDVYGGIYFRDEGDCVVGVFSKYFSNSVSNKDIQPFCKAVVGKTYGAAKLSAKCCVAIGQIAIYQKAHEAGSDDWSAEGQPFVNAARLEHSVPSKPAVFYFNHEFKPAIEQTINYRTTGAPGRYFWEHETQAMQVAGLGFEGGWTDIRVIEHIPGGRVDS